MLILGAKDSILSGSKSRFGEDLLAENMLKTFLSRLMYDFLIACKSAGIMATFKKELLTRFVGTDEGEVTK